MTGRVFDTTGLPLSGVTVFLTIVEWNVPPGCARFEATVARPHEGSPITIASSDAEGVFSVELAPGRYRVAAFKRGYDVAVSDVNTLARPFFNLQMHPAPRVVLGDLPVGSAGGNLGLGWILRQQPSDVLRDERPVIAVDPGAVRLAEGRGEPGAGGWRAAPAGALERADRPLLGLIGGELEHLYAGAGQHGESALGAGITPDHSTNVALHGAIGDDGTWRLDARRGLSSAELGGAGGRQGRRSDRMAFGVEYQLSPQDSLDTEVRYSTTRYVVDPIAGTIDATEQDQRTLGLRTRWDHTLSGGSRVYVDGTFFRTGVRLPDPLTSPFAGLPGEDGARNSAFDRSWETMAGVELSAGRHLIDVGMGTRSYRFDHRNQGVLLLDDGASPSLLELGERGIVVSLFGGDRWSPRENYEIDYGVRYHAVGSEGAACFVPRLGLTRRAFANGALTLRSMVLYRLDDAGPSSPEGPSGSARDRAELQAAGRLGYMLGVERRPADGLQVSATLSYQPFVEEPGGTDAIPAPGAWLDSPLFMSDGAAGHHEFLVELARSLGAVRGSLTGSVGTVQGRMTPTLEEAPVQILTPGEVRYYRTGLRAFITPSDTEVQVDFRRVQAESGAGSAASPVGYRRLDLVVSQNLPWFVGAGGARFRVLMAYQGLHYGSLFDVPAGAVVPGTASRISGGVDIRF